MKLEALEAVVLPRVDGRGRTWLTEAVAVAAAGDLPGLLTAYTAAPKRVGRGSLDVHDDERRSLAGRDEGAGFAHWTLYDAVRALLLLSAGARLDADRFTMLARACYEQGDAREQQSWLRALAWLPAAERFVDCAIDACRTNIVPTFESIACENAYPQRYFPVLHFNQMVLKAMFVGVALDRIVGLDARLNPELSRMARDYRAERLAAGRPVPDDLARALNDEPLENVHR